MSAAASAAPTALAFERPFERPSERLARLAELAAFVALAGLVALAWSPLVDDPRGGRIALAVLAATIGAAGAQAAARAPSARLRILAVLLPVVAMAVGVVAIGVPARLLAPAGWSELSTHIRTGIRELGDTKYPYAGSDDWARVTAQLAIPLILGLMATLAFRRGASGRRLRILALAIGIAGFAVPSIMNSADASLTDGAALYCVTCAWVWLPGVGGTGARRMAATVAVVAGLSIPVVAVLGSESPIVDYTSWNPFKNIADVSESFGWDQTYGPLDWERNGTVLLHVQSHGPHYWRTVVLDQFDGFGWSSSLGRLPGDTELPPGASASRASTTLNPEWVSQLHFEVGDLTSDTVIGAGTILSVDGLDGTQSDGTRVTMPADDPLSSGDTYTVKAYVPDPTPTQLRIAPQRFPSTVIPYRTLSLPVTERLPGFASQEGSGIPLDRGPGSQSQVTLERVAVPAWRPHADPSPAVERQFAASPYARAYALARKLTAGASNEYEAVQAVERRLKLGYSYSEVPPARRFPLSAFLFKDRVGYCQQFSGSMALMLRMLGIPARVASGFAPGNHEASGEYRVSDLDAHAWVEVYFSRIGWVPFDPTPSVAPAARQPGALHASPAPVRTGPREFRGARGAAAPLPDQPQAQRSSSGAPAALIAFAVLIAATCLAVAAVVLIRMRRFRAAPAAAAAESQLRELERALTRLRYRVAPGATLLGLEHRLGTVAGPAAAGYTAGLRNYRYAANVATGPTLAARKAMRRELAATGGRRTKLRALLAIPPGAPSVPRKLRKGKPGESDGAVP